MSATGAAAASAAGHAGPRFVGASRQQWLLRGVATVAATVAMAVAAGVGGWPAAAVVAPTLLAALASIRPDSHLPLVVDAAIVGSLALAIDDPATPWLPVAAVCLVIRHAATTLAASLPVGGALAPSIVSRWVRQAAAIAAGTVGLWVVVVVLDRRDLPGSAVLTALALTVAAALALAVRERSTDRP
ncbi:MAG: hypothetical protein ACRBI6_01275 [Acidimicrobiales bacterium]